MSGTASEWTFPAGDLMKGKRGLVMGVANERSIAWGISQQLAAQGPTSPSPTRATPLKSGCGR